MQRQSLKLSSERYLHTSAWYSGLVQFVRCKNPSRCNFSGLWTRRNLVTSLSTNLRFRLHQTPLNWLNCLLRVEYGRLIATFTTHCSALLDWLLIFSYQLRSFLFARVSLERNSGVVEKSTSLRKRGGNQHQSITENGERSNRRRVRERKGY